MIIDQGVFLEYYLDDTYADECERIVQALVAGNSQGTLSDFHLHGTIAIFNTYFTAAAPDEIQDLLFSITTASGLDLYRLSLMDQTRICEIQRNSDLDFDDATLVHLIDVRNTETILTLDGNLQEYAGSIDFDVLHPEQY